LTARSAEVAEVAQKLKFPNFCVEKGLEQRNKYENAEVAEVKKKYVY